MTLSILAEKEHFEGDNFDKTQGRLEETEGVLRTLRVVAREDDRAPIVCEGERLEKDARGPVVDERERDDRNKIYCIK